VIRNQVTDRRAACHVGADFCDEHAGGGFANAGHRRQQADGGAKGAERVSDARFNRGDGALCSQDSGSN
jgi:hypothetical protein